MNKKKKVITIFIIAVIIQFLVGIYVFNLADKAEKNNKKNSNVLKEKIKTDSNYAIYLGQQKVTLKELDGSMILYKNVTMKYKNGKLKTIADFGIASVSKQDKEKILKILKNIEKAELLKNNDIKNFKDKNNLIVVSGPNFYIDIYRKGKCYIYRITNNKKTISKYFKYCQKGDK